MRTIWVNALLIVGLASLVLLNNGCQQTTPRLPFIPTSSLIEVFTGADIIDNEYHIYLAYRPVVSSGEEFYDILKVDGNQLTPEVDYSYPQSILDSSTGYYYTSPEARLAYINDRKDPSDGHQTGTIKILSPDLICATSEVSVIYTYYKSMANTYIGTGEGSVGPYYLEGVKNIVTGSEYVQVNDQGSTVIITYVRNSSFEADAGDVGYAFNYDKENPYVKFNKALDTSKEFRVYYKYVP